MEMKMKYQPTLINLMVDYLKGAMQKIILDQWM